MVYRVPPTSTPDPRLVFTDETTPRADKTSPLAATPQRNNCAKTEPQPQSSCSAASKGAAAERQQGKPAEHRKGRRNKINRTRPIAKGWSKCDGPLGVAQVRRKHGGIQAGRLGGRAPEPHGCALGPRPPGKPSAIAHPGGSAGDEKPYPGAERPTREFESP